MKEDSKDVSLTRRGTVVLLGSLSAVSGCLGLTSESANENTPQDTSSGLSPAQTFVPEKIWDYETRGEVRGRPTICDGRVYVGSRDGYLYALEGDGGDEGKTGDGCDATMFKYDLAGTNAPETIGPEDGIVKRWKFPTDGGIAAAPLVVDGDVLFGSSDHSFYSVSAESGEENWSIDLDGVVGGSGVYYDGTLYFSSGHSGRGATGIIELDESGVLYAVDPEDGDIIWRREKEQGIQSSLIAHDGLVYFGCQDDRFYAADTETGEEVWAFEADGNFCASRPALRDGILYVGCEDFNLYALDADDGSLIWEFETDDYVVSSPVATDDAVYVGSHDHNLYAVDPESGEELWQTDTGGKVFSSPAYREGTVYVGMEGEGSGASGEVLALDAASGDVVWRFQTGSHVLSSPVVDADDTIYVGSNDRNIYAIESRVAEQ